ncbi:hypothetical protein [Streptomyces umbrinus]
MYLLHRLRDDLHVRVYERGDGVAAPGNGTGIQAPAVMWSRCSVPTPSIRSWNRSGATATGIHS